MGGVRPAAGQPAAGEPATGEPAAEEAASAAPSSELAGSDVHITSTRTRDERDAEARRNAIDVEAINDAPSTEPASKRVKAETGISPPAVPPPTALPKQKPARSSADPDFEMLESAGLVSFGGGGLGFGGGGLGFPPAAARAAATPAAAARATAAAPAARATPQPAEEPIELDDSDETDEDDEEQQRQQREAMERRAQAAARTRSGLYAPTSQRPQCRRDGDCFQRRLPQHTHARTHATHIMQHTCNTAPRSDSTHATHHATHMQRRFDGTCFQRNPIHFKRFAHPLEAAKPYCPNLLSCGECDARAKREQAPGDGEEEEPWQSHTSLFAHCALPAALGAAVPAAVPVAVPAPASRPVPASRPAPASRPTPAPAPTPAPRAPLSAVPGAAAAARRGGTQSTAGSDARARHAVGAKARRPGPQQPKAGVLCSKFNVPPMSALDARQGYWQARALSLYSRKPLTIVTPARHGNRPSPSPY